MMEALKCLKWITKKRMDSKYKSKMEKSTTVLMSSSMMS